MMYHSILNPEIWNVTKGTFKLTDIECACKIQRILLRRMWVLSISTSRTCQTSGQHLSERYDDTKYNVINDITKMTSVIELSNALNEKIIGDHISKH